MSAKTAGGHAARGAAAAAARGARAARTTGAAPAASASSAIAAGVAKIGSGIKPAYAVAVAHLTGSAGYSGLRIVAGTRAVTGRAAHAAAQTAFVLWVAARSEGRALAHATNLVARHAGAVARAVATHPIHAET